MSSETIEENEELLEAWIEKDRTSRKLRRDRERESERGVEIESPISWTVDKIVHTTDHGRDPSIVP